MDDWGVGTMLRDLVAVEPPPSRVDGRQAISGAKRRRRRRRIGLLVTGVIVVAVAVVATVLPATRDTPTPVADQPRTWNTKPSFLFDPTHFTLALDWRPAGVTRVEQESGGASQRLTLLRTFQVGGAPTFVPIATIDVYGTGQVMPMDDPGFRRTEPIYDKGASGHWRAKNDEVDHAGSLWWFWGPGAWAVLTVVDSPKPLDLALRLAKALRTDRDTPVRMPFTVAPPAGTRLVHTATATGPGATYAAEARFAPGRGWPADRWVAVSATNDRAAVTSGTPYVPVATRLWQERENLTPALTARSRPTAQDLVGVTAVTNTTEQKALLDAAGVRLLVAATKLVDNPGNPRNWR